MSILIDVSKLASLLFATNITIMYVSKFYQESIQLYFKVSVSLCLPLERAVGDGHMYSTNFKRQVNHAKIVKYSNDIGPRTSLAYLIILMFMA